MSDSKKTSLFMSSNYSMELAAQNPTYLFVFSDNLARAGTGKDSGQAVVRNAPNSLGIATKKAPNNNPESFFSDKPEELTVVKSDIAALIGEVKSGKWSAVVFPSDGFGTGRAKLQTCSPKIFSAMNKMLDQVISHALNIEEQGLSLVLEEKAALAPPIFYVIAKDNLGRDYYNDKLVGTFETKILADKYCDENNHENAVSYNCIIESLSAMNLESAYDVNGEVPTFEIFLAYTGLSLIPEADAIDIYCDYYKVSADEILHDVGDIVLAVVGSRGFTDRKLLFDTLSVMYENGDFTSIVSGGAEGPDSFAEEWAAENNVEVLVLKPDWEKYGKPAGFKRNIEIWDKAHRGIAFWDGKSKGTAHSFEIAEKQGKHIVTIVSAPQEASAPAPGKDPLAVVSDPLSDVVADMPIAIADTADAVSLDANLPDCGELDEVDLLLMIPTMCREDQRVEAENPNIHPLVAEALACGTYLVNKALWFNPAVPDEVKAKLKEHFLEFPRIYDDAFYHFYDKEEPLFRDDEECLMDEAYNVNP